MTVETQQKPAQSPEQPNTGANPSSPSVATAADHNALSSDQPGDETASLGGDPVTLRFVDAEPEAPVAEADASAASSRTSEDGTPEAAPPTVGDPALPVEPIHTAEHDTAVDSLIPIDSRDFVETADSGQALAESSSAKSDSESEESDSDAVVPIESRDFIREQRGEREVPKPPKRQRRPEGEATPDRDWQGPPAALVGSDAALLETRSPTDAPVARNTTPPASARGSRSISFWVGLTLLGAGGVLAARQAMREPTTDPEVGSSVTLSQSEPSDETPQESGLHHELENTAAPAGALAVAPGPSAPTGNPVSGARLTEAAARGAGAVVRSSEVVRKPEKPNALINTEAVQPAMPSDQPFDSAAASTAIERAASRALACKQPNDPVGMAAVNITFSPTGRVTSANVVGQPFAGTNTGGCIAAAMRNARVPPFAGDFVTVKKSVKIE